MSIVQSFEYGMEQTDVADLLPEAAAAKLRSIRQSLDDARAVASPVFEKLQKLRIDRQGHAARLKQLLDPRGVGGYSMDESDIQTRDEKKRIDRIDAEVTRLRELDEVRSHKRSEISGLVEAIEDYVRSGRPSGTIFAPIEVETPTLRKAETFAEAIEARRRRLRELVADAHQIESRPLPSSVAKARMRQQVERWAFAGAPSVEAAIWFGTDIKFPTVTLTSEIRLERELGLAFGETSDTIALMAWWDRDGLVARLDAEIMAACDDDHALTSDEKAKQLAVLAGDALAVSRQEEALICLASTSGTHIMRRPDADPRAILGIELISAVSRSSPMSLVSKLIDG